MSRRKDRARLEAMQRLNPDYKGFRGHEQEPTRKAPLETVVCTVCQRRRSIPIGTALQEGDQYVCLNCREEGHGLPANGEE